MVATAPQALFCSLDLDRVFDRRERSIRADGTDGWASTDLGCPISNLDVLSWLRAPLSEPEPLGGPSR